MTSKLSNILSSIVLFIFALFGVSGIIISPTVAALDVCDNSLPESVLIANGCDGHAETSTLETSIVGILNGIIGVIALVAVVFVIIGGIGYTTSLGDVGKIKTAKNTILYALIGIVICALSFAIVNWLIPLLH